MQSIILSALLCLCSFSTWACEICINNLTNQNALAWIDYEPGLHDEVIILPHRTLFVDLYHHGSCHPNAYFRLYRYDHELYFSGLLSSGQVFDITP